MGQAQTNVQDRMSLEKQIQSQNKFLANQSSDSTIDQKSQNSQQIPHLNTQDMIREIKHKIIQDYQLISPPIGQGSFGEVRKAIHIETKAVRAVKIIHKNNRSNLQQQQLINEVQILKEIDHPHILKIYEFYQDQENFFIVTEYCEGGELFDQIVEEHHFNESKAAIIFKQIISAIMYCHNHNIVHRDIKPENLLLQKKNDLTNIKVIDFGTSSHFDSKKMHIKQGTVYYMAPEVLNENYDEKCDVWSLGVILFIMLCGYPPFNGNDDEQIFQKIKKGEFQFKDKDWLHVSDKAKNLIKKLLVMNPNERISAKEAFQDPWVQEYACEEKSKSFQATEEALINMKKYHTDTKIQQAIYLMMVEYSSTQEQKDKLLTSFQALDLNGDGVLSKEELQEGFHSIMHVNNSEKLVSEIINTIDNNGNGCLDYTEFVMAATDAKLLVTKQNLQKIFNMVDQFKTGRISIEDFQQFFGQSIVDNQDWQDMMDKINQKTHNYINFEDFQILMDKLIHPTVNLKRSSIIV